MQAFTSLQYLSGGFTEYVQVGQTTFITLGSVSPDMKITEITYFRPHKQKYGCSQGVNPLPCQSRRNSDLSSLEDVQSRLWILILRTFCL